MMKKQQVYFIMFALLILTCFVPQPASAYVGPGAGLSAIGAFLAIIAAVVAAIFGFLWYPIKRLIKKYKKPDIDKQSEST